MNGHGEVMVQERDGTGEEIGQGKSMDRRRVRAGESDGTRGEMGAGK